MKDELLDEARRVVIATQSASISYLQRRLRIGFSRAAMLMDALEAEGTVSAPTAAAARVVLVQPERRS